MKIFAASAGGLRPKRHKGAFFLPKEGGFGAFSVSSARGFLSGRSALKYKRENRNFLYQTFLFRFLEFCLKIGKTYYFLRLLLIRPSWILGPLHPPMMETIRSATVWG